jgi:hypothetical protein
MMSWTMEMGLKPLDCSRSLPQKLPGTLTGKPEAITLQGPSKALTSHLEGGHKPIIAYAECLARLAKR